MKQLNTTKVSQLCLRVTSGGTPSRANPEFWDGGTIPWMKTGEVNQGFVYATEEKITEHGFENSAAQMIPKNSVIVALYGDGYTAGSVAVNKIDLTTNQACCNLIVDPKKCHYSFLYYYLKGSYNNLVSLKSGGSQQNLNALTVRSFPVRAVERSDQLRIAAILSAYDELIENNKRRIALLEKLAEEIYREWFVRLRFPGHEKAKFVKGLPTDWDIKRVKEIVVRKNFGRIYREAELFSDGQVVVIDQSRADSLGFYDGEPQHLASPDSPIILFGDHTCKMVFMTKPFSLAENLIPFKPKPGVSPYFLYHLVKDLATTTEYKRHWTDLTNREVLIPKEDVQIKFENEVREIHEQIELLRQAIRKTEKIRNLLLPRLISGKLPVENLDIQFPPGMAEELNAEPTAVHA